MGGASRIGAAVGVAGIGSMTRAARATATMAEPLERNENGKRLRRGLEASRAPSDWRCRIQRTLRQQTPQITQLH